MNQQSSPGWAAMAVRQAGVISRGQLRRVGLTAGQARADVEAGRWQRLHLGVYATFTGPVSALALVWAAVLAAGAGAVAGPVSTLWLVGVLDRPPTPLDVWIPHDRRVSGLSGVVVRRSRDLARARHPVASPPRLRVEPAILALADASTRPGTVIDLVLRAVQRRFTTARRLLDWLAARRAHRWRTLLTEVLSDVVAGVRSPLERRWLHDVHRRHRLPPAAANDPDRVGTRRQYRDFHYRRWRVLCELDGWEAHPDDERFRDRARDNLVTVSGRVTLRYGWREVAGDPCGVAAQVVTVLRAQGWTGQAYPCSATCPLAAVNQVVGNSVSPEGTQNSPRADRITHQRAGGVGGG